MADDSKKKTLWWNQEVKEAIRAKKDAFKTLLRDRLSSNYLQSRYTEARKAVTLAVKTFKKLRKEFGHRLDSNYFLSNIKVFWQIIRRFRGRRSSVAYSIKNLDFFAKIASF